MRVGFTLLMVGLLVSGCTTPATVLKHPKTGDVASCGGEYAASLAGGAIGYNIQKDKDAQCVTTYKAKGYRVVK